MPTLVGFTQLTPLITQKALDRSTMEGRDDNARSLACYLYPAQRFECQQAQNGCH